MLKFWLATLAFSAASAMAQPFPSKPIRMIVPLVPGGNQDIVARAVAEELSKNLGQQVIVENRPGAERDRRHPVREERAAPTATRCSRWRSTFARVPGVVKAAGYDPRSDFTGVSLVCRIPQVLVVHPNNPARTVQDLVAQAKAKPGEISFAGSGNGSTGHVAAELFMRHAGIKLLQVSYKGNAQALFDVMGGQVAMMFDQVSTSGGHVKGGKLRALAVTTRSRSQVLPEVPTLHELGFNDFDDVTWNGIVAPAATPREIVSSAARGDRKRSRESGDAPPLRRARHRAIGERFARGIHALCAHRGGWFLKLVKDAGIQVE